MFTANESKIIRYLMTAFEPHSINEIAKECHLAPNGAYKILKKLEKEEIITFKEISNIKAYDINFENSLILSYLKIALRDDRINQPKIKVRLRDLNKMKNICKSCILFGSYIRGKEKPRDLDIFFVFEKNQYKYFKRELDEIQEIIPYHIHDVVQTEQDLINNLKKQDEVIIEIIRNGIVLWGHDLITRSIKNVQTKRKTKKMF